MPNWQACKYDSLIVLHNDVANNSLWCSAAVNTPRNGSCTTTHNKGEVPMPMSL
jgi:hypothetical protein